jgi:CMP-N-acetylneuraminic acid synthetase
MSCVAIIPARGGSRRLPRKNIIDLDGQPMITWIIGQALESGVFSDVIVSSEDDEILRIADEYGATSHKRPIQIAQDRSTVVEVCLEVLSAYQVDTFCCLYATSALLKASTIRDSWQVFSNDLEARVLMGVSSYNYPPVQALKLENNGYAKMLMPEFSKLQSQFHPKTRVSNGSLYWARRDSFVNERTFYSDKLKVFDVPEDEVCDLDTPEDLLRLKAKFSGRV